MEAAFTINRFSSQVIVGSNRPSCDPPHDRSFQNNATSNRKKSSMFDVAWPATHTELVYRKRA